MAYPLYPERVYLTTNEMFIDWLDNKYPDPPVLPKKQPVMIKKKVNFVLAFIRRIVAFVKAKYKMNTCDHNFLFDIREFHNKEGFYRTCVKCGKEMRMKYCLGRPITSKKLYGKGKK